MDNNQFESVEELYKTWNLTEEKIPFDRFKEYRFVYGWKGDCYPGEKIETVYNYKTVYYYAESFWCSCYGFEWEPERVTAKFVKHKYPDVDIRGNIFED